MQFNDASSAHALVRSAQYFACNSSRMNILIKARIRKFFERFPDTEGEQATIRALFCPLVAAAYMYSLPEQDGPWQLDHRLLYVMVMLYAIAALLILLALLAHPEASKPRRVTALFVTPQP